MDEYIDKSRALREWPVCDEPADAYQFIRDYPAADVVPVVHGEWVYAYWCEFKCSNCGAWSKSEPYRGRENFCPNCGAKMDGGDERG